MRLKGFALFRAIIAPMEVAPAIGQAGDAEGVP
jgi:hypothetical protein